MNNQDVLNRVDEMLPDAIETIRKRCNSILNSGAVDLSDWGDNYRLPKALLVAALSEVEHQYIADVIKPAVKRFRKV